MSNFDRCLVTHFDTGFCEGVKDGLWVQAEQFNQNDGESVIDIEQLGLFTKEELGKTCQRTIYGQNRWSELAAEVAIKPHY